VPSYDFGPPHLEVYDVVTINFADFTFFLTTVLLISDL
jgi:hypothetical protein